MRLFNPLVRRVLKSRAIGRHVRLQAVLEFEGRRSGKTLRVPICLHEIEDGPTVFTERPWRLNFTESRRVTVTHRGIVRTGTAILLDLTPEEFGICLRQALDNARPFELGLKVARSYDPTPAELGQLARFAIRIRFDDN
ncbi:grhN [Antrihabitans sp. YC2-6]|nr:grhN [Antrihabitans sp. YC2-6]